MPDQQTVRGDWAAIRDRIRSTWSQVTDDDLQQFNGDVDQLVGRIQQRTGESRETIRSRLNEILEQEGGAASMFAAAGEYARRGQASAVAAYRSVASAARSGYGQAEANVSRHPGVSVATAFGVGVVVGLVIGLSSRS